VGAAESISIRLDASRTQALLLDVPAAYNTNMNEALLTAWAQAWVSEMGETEVSVVLEGHGREEAVVGEVDLTRSVGWFTTQYPVHLSVTGADNPGQALRAVKERLRRVPDNGLGYMLLRYLHPGAPLASMPEPQILFNYLGQFERALPASSMFSLVRPLQAGYAPSNRRTHSLEINAYIQQGQLNVDLVFSPRLLPPAAVKDLAEKFEAHLQALIDHCLSDDAGGRTASDFDLVDLSEDQFDRLSQMLSKLDGPQ
jgi:non-ribosomal peptide synthase protein (TIGR01720 family)